MYTTADEAEEYVKQTGVCCLAVLIGNAHGHYKKTPKLDIERVKAIREATGGIPLVLHGGSGLSDDDFRSTIKNGIAKINIYTDLCVAGENAMRENVTDGTQGMMGYLNVRQARVEAMKQAVKEKMKLFGSVGKA